MPPVTTQSGQAARTDLIAMFEEAQALVGAEHARATGMRTAIREAVMNGQVQEHGEYGDYVDVRLPRASWRVLRAIADLP